MSRNDSQLASEVEGRIAWVAEVGTVVKAGDVVARIDNKLAGLQLAVRQGQRRAPLRAAALRPRPGLAHGQPLQPERHRQIDARPGEVDQGHGPGRARAGAGELPEEPVPVHPQRHPRAVPRPRRGAADQRGRIRDAGQGGGAPRRHRRAGGERADADRCGALHRGRRSAHRRDREQARASRGCAPSFPSATSPAAPSRCA